MAADEQGVAQGVLVVQHSGKSGMVQAGLKGTYQPPTAEAAAQETEGKVEIAPDSMDFGTSAGGIPLVRSIVVSNHLPTAVKIQNILLNAPDQAGFTYKSLCPAALTPGEACNIIVTWQPTSKGLAQGVLAVQHSGKSGMAQAEVKGTFTPPTAEAAAKETEGKVEIAPESMDFGTSAGRHRHDAFTGDEQQFIAEYRDLGCRYGCAGSLGFFL